MSSLGTDAQQLLLGLARRAIEVWLTEHALPVVPQIALLQRRQGAFVTLFRNGELRGCIGQVEPLDGLGEVIVWCAVAAATRDPRFPPLTLAELPQTEVEISLLSPPVPVRPEELLVGRHGILVSRDGRHGLLLPQVAAERAWTAERFLSEACRKAGLAPQAWRDPGTQLYAFTAEVFRESELALLRQRGAIE
jgi:AmmeMemoRadiSam system protein A